MIKLLYKLSILLTLYHTPFQTADALTVNMNWNVTVASRIFGCGGVDLYGRYPSKPKFYVKNLEVDFKAKSICTLQFIRGKYDRTTMFRKNLWNDH